MVPLGLWNDKRLPSFFSGVFFWPVSESKRGKVRITFMFLSPQLVTSCRFPALWVDSSFVNSEQASQPAMWAVSAGALSLSCSASILLLSLYHTVLSLRCLPLPLSSPPCPPHNEMTAIERASPCPPSPFGTHDQCGAGWPPSGQPMEICSGCEPERRRRIWIQMGSRKERGSRVGAKTEGGWKKGGFSATCWLGNGGMLQEIDSL